MPSGKENILFNNYYILLGMRAAMTASLSALTNAADKQIKQIKQIDRYHAPTLSLFAHPGTLDQKKESHGTLEKLIAAKAAFTREGAQEDKVATDKLLLAEIKQIHDEVNKPNVNYYDLLGIENNALTNTVKDQLDARIQALTLTKLSLPPDDAENKHRLEEVTDIIYKTVWPMMINESERQKYTKE